MNKNNTFPVKNKGKNSNKISNISNIKKIPRSKSSKQIYPKVSDNSDLKRTHPSILFEEFLFNESKNIISFNKVKQPSHTKELNKCK